MLYTSKTLSYYWNFGRILGIVIFFQIFSGIFLTFYYSNDSLISFDRVQYIMYEVSGGWIIRIFHFNGASFFFIFIYLHFLKGLFFFSYRLKGVWFFGLTLFLLFIIVAFIGYVLVWAQISFWASVVITSLLTVIPYIGFDIVFLIWGGFSVTRSMLKFFFTLHFLLPWLSWILVFYHLFFLHMIGRTSNIFCFLGLDKINFFPYFLFKDFLNIVVFFYFFLFCLLKPFFLGDVEIFVDSNILISPIHIVPEWYYLLFYGILRCIPNKMFGVFLIIFSIFVFFIFLILFFKFNNLDIFNSVLVFNLLILGVLLSWLGQSLIEYPFIILSTYLSLFYFINIFLIFVIFFMVFIFYF